MIKEVGFLGMYFLKLFMIFLLLRSSPTLCKKSSQKLNLLLSSLQLPFLSYTLPSGSRRHRRIV